MRLGKRKIIVIGDRILIKPDENSEKTPAGLYLPPTVQDKEDVWGGIVTDVGPGMTISDPNNIEEEPWKTSSENYKFIPTQVEIGDYALFLKKASVELKLDNKKYLILPQSAILVVIRANI